MGRCVQEYLENIENFGAWIIGNNVTDFLMHMDIHISIKTKTCKYTETAVKMSSYDGSSQDRFSTGPTD